MSPDDHSLYVVRLGHEDVGGPAVNGDDLARDVGVALDESGELALHVLADECGVNQPCMMAR